MVMEGLWGVVVCNIGGNIDDKITGGIDIIPVKVVDDISFAVITAISMMIQPVHAFEKTNGGAVISVSCKG